MHAVLCDVCERPIFGKALELHHLWGEAVNTEEGRPRIAARGQSGMYFLCAACGLWVEQAIAHLREQTRNPETTPRSA
jgi:hypothetical protein